MRKGISANLCEAAAKLIELGNGLDASVTWARTRRAPEPRRSVQFTLPDADVLWEAARLFREREPLQDEILEGFVVKLARSEHQKDGSVTMRTVIDGKRGSVKIDLLQASYEEAVRAHENRLIIAIKGDLVKDGHRWKLKNPRDLSVVEPDEADDAAE